MANSPIQNIVYFSDFLFDFKKHPVTNDLILVSNEQSVMNSIKKILKTNHYEVPYNPMFGANISHYLFENFTPVTQHMMETDIRFAIKNWEPRVDILDLIVSGSPDENSINITMTFSMINNPNPVILTTTLFRIR
jgi:phage baseplate assembly protein W